MADKPIFYDGWTTLQAGMDGGVAPFLLDPDQAGFATNVTFRGSFPTDRPPFKKINLNTSGQVPGTFSITIAKVYDQATSRANGSQVLTNSITRYVTANTVLGAGPTAVPVAGTFPADLTLPCPIGFRLEGSGIYYATGTMTIVAPNLVTIQADPAFVGTTVGAGSACDITLPAFLRPPSLNPFPLIAHTVGSFNVPTTVGGTVTIFLDTAFTGSVGDTIFIGYALSVGQYTVSAINAHTPATSALLNLNFQGACYFKPVTGPESLMAAIGGRLFQFIMKPGFPDDTFVVDQTIPGDANPATYDQAWLWQSENWVIWNDGFSIPVFFDNVTSRRSLGFPKELPPGRMGAYGMGRNWVSLPDGRAFMGGDLVGSASGTAALNFLDAVLKTTQNTFLNGGGNFIVPGNVGLIQAMSFTATLDASLGQGPLQVLTPSTVFSVNTPVDAATWTAIVNPILTESLIGNGGQSQNATIMANGDLIFRSVDGIRSLILARRDFYTWGNVPQSFEVSTILEQDDPSLLRFGSAVIFDNRLLMTCTPVKGPQGVYHQGLIALNFDEVSSLRGKAPSIYDGLWQGLNVFQVLTGIFNSIQRTFAFCYNTTTASLEMYELLPTGPNHFDNGNQAITWSFESPVLFKNVKNKGQFDYVRLVDGELYIDDLIGTAQFQVFFRPDYDTCWTPWHNWSICALNSNGGKTQYRRRMGFGLPTTACDPTTNKPFREGSFFQLKIQVTGHCRVMGCRVSAVPIPQPEMAPPICEKECL